MTGFLKGVIVSLLASALVIGGLIGYQSKQDRDCTEAGDIMFAFEQCLEGGANCLISPEAIDKYSKAAHAQRSIRGCLRWDSDQEPKKAEPEAERF